MEEKPGGAAPSSCKTAPVSPTIHDFGYCLAPSRRGCDHAVHFGDGVLCFHPQWKSFLRVPPRPSGG